MSPRFLDCTHCGFCLPVCPTFAILGTETDSPRGRIYLMRALAEGRAEATDSVREHLDACLGCRACESACPSGVQYGELLEEARDGMKGKPRPMMERMSRSLLLSTLTNPDRLAMAMGGASLLGGAEPAMPGLLVSLLTGKPASRMILPSRPRLFRREYPSILRPVGEVRGRVGFLTGCVMSVLFEPVNDATIRSFLRNGLEVHIPGDQGCCGALHSHNGELDAAREMARRNIDVFASRDIDHIVTNSAGCGSAMKEYGHLLKGDPAYAAKARAFAERVRDISEVLADLPDLAPFQDTPARIAYHDACHLAHGQKVRIPPRSLLERIPGVTLAPLTESDWCCGSAGIYNFVQPEIAAQLLERKVENIIDAGADWLVTGNPGCFMWIANGLKAAGSPIRVMHTIEALDLAWGGEATAPPLVDP